VDMGHGSPARVSLRKETVEGPPPHVDERSRAREIEDMKRDKSQKPAKAADGDLTAKQQAFCLEYLVDLNATQAAIRAGYSPRTARQAGAENMTKPVIQAFVLKLMQERSKRVEITADTVLRELLKLAMVDIGEAFNEDGGLKPIHDMPADVRRAIAGVDVFAEFEGRGEEREQVGTTKKIRFWDKTKALEMLGRHLKLFTDKLEHSGGLAVNAPAELSPEAEKELQDTVAAVRSSLKIPEGLKPLGK
jgi:phage terminase small subunit